MRIPPPYPTPPSLQQNEPRRMPRKASSMRATLGAKQSSGKNARNDDSPTLSPSLKTTAHSSARTTPRMPSQPPSLSLISLTSPLPWTTRQPSRHWIASLALAMTTPRTTRNAHVISYPSSSSYKKSTSQQAATRLFSVFCRQRRFFSLHPSAV
jgi:hypothetical protein